jgi:hypothetical protein
VIKKKTMAAIGLTIAFAGAGVTVANAAAGGAVTQSSTVSVDSTSASPVSVGTVNSQFSIKLAANDGTTSCGVACNTTYTAGVEAATMTCPPSDCTLPGAGFGAVIYRVNRGPWTELTNTTTISGQAQVGQVELAYNDDDFTNNSGSYTVTVTRTKA